MSSQNIVSIDNDQYLPEYGWTKSQVEIIKNLYCKGGTDDDLKVFSHICKHTKLDPFLKQIYAIRRGGSMTYQTSIDGYRLIAERTGNYSPGRETTYTENSKGEIISATSYVKKMTPDGTWHEIGATAYFSEYNSGQNLWNKMPRVMIAKCAEAIALRKAFPNELGAIYTKEEMDQADKEERMEEPVKAVQKQSKVVEVSVSPVQEERISKEDYQLLGEIFSKTTPEYQENFSKNLKDHFKVLDFKDIPARAVKSLTISMQRNIDSHNSKRVEEIIRGKTKV